jgi:hypothetical protein
VQSFYDTPEIYQFKQSKDVPLRKDIRRYLRGRGALDIIKFPEYTPENINEKIPAEDLQFLSAFDFRLNSQFTFDVKAVSIKPPASTTTNSNSRYGGIDRTKPKNAKAKEGTNIYTTSELESHRTILFRRLNDSVRSPMSMMDGCLLTFLSW